MLLQLLVGLGNRGPKYVGNRHNVGFMAVQEIAERHNFSKWRPDFHGVTSEGVIADIKTLLLLPSTLMNESGRAVAAAMTFHKLPLDCITVLHDEIELHPAYVRVKIGGGNAGHNGLRSITSHIGNDYRRVCIGVGRPTYSEIKVERYVLSDFEPFEHSWLSALLKIIADDINVLLQGENDNFEKNVRQDMFDAGFGGMLSYSSSRPKKTKTRQGPPSGG
jgi:PTH1 family peptidyl-tRNA hydrolase